MDRKLFFRILILIIIALLIVPSLAFARAGGAGGSRSSGSSYSGGGGGDGGMIVYLIFTLVRLIGPVPTFLIVVGVIIFGNVYSKISKRNNTTTLRNMPQQSTMERIKGFKKFQEANPDFQFDKFKEKVKSAFLAIQQGWSKKDISGVRRYISDGVYQRFSTQFTMMDMLRQHNDLTDIKVLDIYLDSVEVDGNFDIVHVGITASLKDHFVCDLSSKLNSGGFEKFTEYWSFIRKRKHQHGDIYSTNTCPSCRAELQTDMGERTNCAYCGVLVNNGEFDWVLSEITQADDYASGKIVSKIKPMSPKLKPIIDVYGDFSKQGIEDKASNAYLQILTAVTKKDPRLMRRFVSDGVFEKVQKSISTENIVYNRLYLNSAMLLGIFHSNDSFHLAIGLISTYQRVELNNDNSKISILDPTLNSERTVLVMSRSNIAGTAKGSLYAHTCSSCGAPAENSLDLKCPYCGVDYNNLKNEWIVTEYLTFGEYEEYARLHSGEMKGKIQPAIIDDLYEVKDYALNNIMLVVGADGEYDQREQDFVHQLAKKWNFRKETIDPIAQLAIAGRLTIRMPQNLKKRKRILELMKKAAEADEKITIEEKRILQHIEENYIIPFDR